MSGKALLRAALLLALIACVPGGWIVLGVVVLWDAGSDRGSPRAPRRRG